MAPLIFLYIQVITHTGKNVITYQKHVRKYELTDWSMEYELTD